jgi:hypothetical protein
MSSSVPIAIPAVGECPDALGVDDPRVAGVDAVER